MDTLPTTNNVTSSGSSNRSSLAESAGVQSHVSATNFQHRLRSSSYGPEKRKYRDYFLDDEPEGTLWGTSAGRCLSLVGLRTPRQQARTRLLVKWTFYLYTTLCLVAFTRLLYASCCGLTKISATQNQELDVSALEALPVDVLLSKTTSVYPAPRGLDPFVLKAAVDPSAVTACLWSRDGALGSLTTWATRWTGPISLLVTTSSEPSSPEHKTLLRQLSSLKTKSALINSTLSVHVFHLADDAPENPNAFLNLARMFSQTSRVALFPGNLTVLPPKMLYSSISTSPPTLTALTASFTANAGQPVILTTRSQTNFPFSPLAPVVLQRDAPLWCTERFFPLLSREADWEECLWQVWLEHFGAIDVRQTRGWLHDPPLRSNSATPDSLKMKLRHRLQEKWRSETCVLATRRLAAMKAAERPVDAKKARWLKRTCRPWTTAN